MEHVNKAVEVVKESVTVISLSTFMTFNIHKFSGKKGQF